MCKVTQRLHLRQQTPPCERTVVGAVQQHCKVHKGLQMAWDHQPRISPVDTYWITASTTEARNLGLIPC